MEKTSKRWVRKKKHYFVFIKIYPAKLDGRTYHHIETIFCIIHVGKINIQTCQKVIIICNTSKDIYSWKNMYQENFPLNRKNIKKILSYLGKEKGRGNEKFPSPSPWERHRQNMLRGGGIALPLPTTTLIWNYAMFSFLVRIIYVLSHMHLAVHNLENIKKYIK